MEWFRGKKPVGTVLQRRSGYIYVKTQDRGWVPEGRLVAELKIEKHQLEECEKVYHRDGNRANNKPDNLAVIRFNLTKYRLLPRPQIVYMPKPQVTEKDLRYPISKA